MTSEARPAARDIEDARIEAALKVWRETHEATGVDHDPEDADYAAMMFALEAADAVALEGASPSSIEELRFPRELTPVLSEVLGLMNFRTCPLAHAFRDAGRADIPRKVEAEQAFILHWLVTLALQHGADWRKHADATLSEVIEEAKARAAAQEACT